jgi:hypothetical protein
MDHRLLIVLAMLKVKKKGTVMNADDFDNHYDITDGDGHHDQEEAHFYWTLREFENLIEKHGAAFVLAELNSDAVKLLKDKLNERL